MKTPMDRLIEGNRLFVTGTLWNPNQNPERSQEETSSQKPFAAVLTCADSRVAPEVLFNCRLGDLFVLQAAGNLIDDMKLASLEFAVEHLGVSFIAVIGHQKCEAVQAALQGREAPGYLPRLVEGLAPAIESTDEKSLDVVTQTNARLTMGDIIGASELLEKKFQEGSLQLAAGFSKLDTGEVEWIA